MATGRSSGQKATHLRRPRMKAWKRLRLLLSGARRLTWLYRDPREWVLEPEDRGTVSQGLALLREGPMALPAHLASQMPPPRSRGCSCAAQ